MVKYTIKRMILAIFTTFIILSLTFVLIKMLPFPMPGATSEEACLAYFIKQESLGYVFQSTKKIEGMDALWNYKQGFKTIYFYVKPLGDQYIGWLSNIFTKWDWGVSNQIQPNVEVMAIILSRLPTTVKINIWSVIISVPLGIALGVLAALKKNTMTDHFISTVVMIFISIPSFITITMLMLIFCYANDWLPSKWPLPIDPLDIRIKGYIIPVMALSFGSICGYCRYTRAELCDVMASDYLLLARTKGLTKTQTVTRHALRNAMVPIVPSILAEFVGILGGSMILERLYSIPGIGELFINAISRNDYNVLFVDMALFTCIGLLAGVIVDISYGFIDPRIRMGAKK
ncbi:MAG: ABC transporter permease [Bacilli bacterium]|nr:ABC transporter permease [Bacilli bacterium]MCI7622676.1 ABC transporter permease [Bacilli bacterium]MDD7374594.1 ABC transporter permease [Bacilli bacterium]MDD7549268.1 ABC transporter permease [Bacilli bacterium]MDD7598482.1 ABC transporter permease [Bacilli bacterium]